MPSPRPQRPHRRSGPPHAQRGRGPIRPPKLDPAQGPQVWLSPRGVERWQRGHPWIYRADLGEEPTLAGGELVRVLDHRGWFLGRAFYSQASKIALRWLSFEDGPGEEALFAARLSAADALRQRAYPGQTTYRVVHADADLMPGLVVDRYGEYLSCQFLIKATDDRKALFSSLLQRQFAPKAIVNRSDVNVRTLEGLVPEKGLLFGALSGPVEYSVGSVRMSADLLEGQKTGAFLDQRENHLLSARYASGEALDCFAYLGGFALQLATAAQKVTAVEISEPAAARLRRNAEENGLSNVEVVCANAFDFLRDAVDEGRTFDTIVLDPPSFAKNKGAVEAALRGYKEINLRSLQLLRPGGHLITSSCTYHVDEAMFEQMLDSAAADAKRRVQIIERQGAAKDHPVLLHLRETRYLKCYVLRVVA